MSYDFRAFMVLAEDLAQTDGEAAARSSISRAYYAVYHHARSFGAITSLRWAGQSGKHQKFWDELKRNAAFASVAALGEQLRTARTRSDYDVPPITASELEEAVPFNLGIARQGLDLLDQVR